MNDIDQRLRRLGATIPCPTFRSRTTLREVAGVGVFALGVALAGDVLDDGHSLRAAGERSPAPHRRRRSRRARSLRAARARGLRTVPSSSDYRDVIASTSTPTAPTRRRGPTASSPAAASAPRSGGACPAGGARHGRGLRWHRLERLHRRPLRLRRLVPHRTGCRHQRPDPRVQRLHDPSRTPLQRRGGDHRRRLVWQQLGGSRRGIYIPVDDLVRAAADQRLTPATPGQIRNAGASMGFPEFDELRPGAEGPSECPVPAAPQCARRP